MDAQVVDVMKAFSSPLLAGGFALIGVYLGGRIDKRKRREDMLRARGEELYALSETWINGLTGCFLSRVSVMQGKLTYNQALDLDIAEGNKNANVDFGRLEMLIDVYFPASRTAYDRVIEGRKTLNGIAAAHKRAYETGDVDGRPYLKPFQQAMMEVDDAGKALKASIISELRSV